MLGWAGRAKNSCMRGALNNQNDRFPVPSFISSGALSRFLKWFEKKSHFEFMNQTRDIHKLTRFYSMNGSKPEWFCHPAPHIPIRIH